MSDLGLENATLCDRYLLRGRISSGSYAEIFLACDLADNRREVVVKALNPHLQATTDPDLESFLEEKFQQEADILESLQHPNIISFIEADYDFDATGREVPFIALEYMPGGDLSQLCRSRPGYSLELGEFLAFMQQICAGCVFW